MAFQIGIIGCGAIGTVHAKSAHAAGLEVAGAWDLNPAAAAKLAETYPDCVVHDSLDALLSSEVAAVAVAVPNNAHRDCAVAALDAGKHVLLEKPMALSVAECDDIIAAKERAGAGQVLQLGFVCRGLPTASAVKAMVEEGRFGSIYHVKCSMYRHRGIPGLGGWFTTKALSGGGPLIDLGVHVLDLAMYLTGNQSPVRASGQVVSEFGSPIEAYVYEEMWAGPPKLDGVFDVEDGAVAFIRFANGMTLELNVTWAANVADGVLPSGITILGRDAGCFFELFGKEVRVVSQADGKLTDDTPQFPCEDAEEEAWKQQYAQFIAAVEDGQAPHADAAAGRCVQALIEAIYQSSDAGAEVVMQ